MDQIEFPEDPEYYHADTCEVIDLIEAFNLNFNRGNIIKYVIRAGKKPNEGAYTALKKAQWYLDREVNRIIGYIPKERTEEHGRQVNDRSRIHR